MNHTDIVNAVNQARMLNSSVDSQTLAFAKLIRGRLRSTSGYWEA